MPDCLQEFNPPPSERIPKSACTLAVFFRWKVFNALSLGNVSPIVLQNFFWHVCAIANAFELFRKVCRFMLRCFMLLIAIVKLCENVTSYFSSFLEVFFLISDPKYLASVLILTLFKIQILMEDSEMQDLSFWSWNPSDSVGFRQALANKLHHADNPSFSGHRQVPEMARQQGSNSDFLRKSRWDRSMGASLLCFCFLYLFFLSPGGPGWRSTSPDQCKHDVGDHACIRLLFHFCRKRRRFWMSGEVTE